jgi:hypothetical protein
MWQPTADFAFHGGPLEFASMIVEDSGASGIATATGVAAPDLLVVSDAGSTRLRPGSAHRVGRDPQGAIVLGDPRVSWTHGGSATQTTDRR